MATLGNALYVLRSLQVFPLRQLRLRDEEFLWHLLVGLENIAEHRLGAVEISLQRLCPDLSIPHHATHSERSRLPAPSELLCDLRWVPQELQSWKARAFEPHDTGIIGPNRESGGKGSVFEEPRDRSVPTRFDSLEHPMGNDEHPASSLWEAVMSCVHDAPLDEIPEIGETREDDREVATSLCRRRLQEPIDVLEEDESRPLLLEDPIDRPPEDALLALDPVRLVQRLRDRVVLTREAADQQVVIRDLLAFAGCDLIQDDVDVLVDVYAGPEMADVAVERVLSLGLGLPLVSPDDLPASGLETETESSDAREQLDHLPRRAGRTSSFAHSVLRARAARGRNDTAVISTSGA